MFSRKVLVVDDNQANLKLVCLLLAADGYDIKTAYDAEEALNVLEVFQPELILMDIQLPGMDGLTLARLIKQDPNHASVIIIALTAYAMKGDEERAKNNGCSGYITKPIDTRSFSSTIQDFMQSSDSIVSNRSGG